MLHTLLTNELFALLAVISSGLLLGRVKIGGLTLGSSGVIFTALALGAFGYNVPAAFGLFGLVLFVYCVGLAAGPGFFRVFVRQGKAFAHLSTALVVLATATTWALATAFAIPVDLAAGIFAGAMTSTPALAAAMEALPPGSRVPVGYGIGYPFGVVGILLFVQVLPRLLGRGLDELSARLASEQDRGREIRRVLVEIVNPAVSGKTLNDLGFIADANCQVPRVLRGDRLTPISADFTLEAGQHVLVIGREARLLPVISLLGRRSDRGDVSVDTERERMQVVVSSRNVARKTLGDLKLLSNFGVTVSRIRRHGFEFVPKPADEVEYGDALNVVGEPENLRRFAAFAGHRARTAHETDLISVGIGIIAGIMLGTVSFSLGDSHFALGMAGGPLVVALLLGHFGRVGPIVGHVPPASRMLMLELGLAFFLSNAGVDAGHQLVPVVREYGPALCLASAAVIVLPLSLGYVVGRFALGLNLLEILGGVCGGATSTPGLGIITSKTDSDVPVVSYAAAYPVALILMTVFAQLLVAVLS